MNPNRMGFGLKKKSTYTKKKSQQKKRTRTKRKTKTKNKKSLSQKCPLCNIIVQYKKKLQHIYV